MTTLIIAQDIPPGINTLERLHVWSGYLLSFINPTLGVLEAPDRAEQVAQAAIFQAADNTTRVLLRDCLPLSSSYMSDRTVKLWMHIEEVSNVAIPASFKVN